MVHGPVNFMISPAKGHRTSTWPPRRQTNDKHLRKYQHVPRTRFHILLFENNIFSGPITTGTSVVGLKFTDGVIIAADTLVSYGSLSRFRDIDRVFKVNDHTVIGIGGDYADFQFIKRYIDQKVTEDFCYDDDIQLKPKSLYNWLIRVLYNKRSRFNPLWIDLIVGGMQDGEPFLGHVDMRGRAYEDSSIATAYGKHIAIPLIRGEVEKLGQPPNKEQAIALVDYLPTIFAMWLQFLFLFS